MDKSPDAFRTISEAADELDLPQHVLRFWETRFSTIKPLKRGGGRRYYRPEDVLLLKGIRHLLYDQGFTIKGVQKILKDQGVRYVIGIGEGRPAEALLPGPETPVDLPAESAEQPAEAEAEAPADADGEARPAKSGGFFGLGSKQTGLSQADKDKLSDVLRELLDCKRVLERAREG
ncbi:MerR family transcriptional regulator [Devosia sp.]|uniref:MerR family transcriptional regulator n=1 Tax=Devosia sp. TaxID=1871048 RepID=UPI003A955D7B